MPNPTITFGFLVATLYGGAFHFTFGGGARRLAFFVGASWLGFALGHFTGAWFDVSIFNIGALRFFSASSGAIISLVMTHALTGPRSSGRTQRRGRA